MRHPLIDRGTERKKTAFARFLHINGSIVEDSTRAQNKKKPAVGSTQRAESAIRHMDQVHG